MSLLWRFAGLAQDAAHAAIPPGHHFQSIHELVPTIRHERRWEELGHTHAGMRHWPNWHNVKPSVIHYDPEHPDYEGLYSTQDWVRSDTLHHNIDHPGMHEPGRSGPEEGDEEEWEDGHDGAPTDLPRYYRHPAGGLAIMDGHHRVVTDHLMGATSGMGRVWDDDEHGSSEEHFRPDDHDEGLWEDL